MYILEKSYILRNESFSTEENIENTSSIKVIVKTARRLFAFSSLLLYIFSIANCSLRCQLSASLPPLGSVHRRRIKTKEKTKVVASV